MVEQVETSFAREELASWWQRLFAWVLDTIILGVAFLIGSLAVALVRGHASFSFDSTELRTLLIVLPFAAVWDVAWIGGPARGKPGQRMLGLRVVAINGRRLSPIRALVRSVVRASMWVLQGIPALVSAVTIGVTPRRQALHDLVAGSVCVRADVLARRGEPLASPVAMRVDVEDTSRSRGPFL